MDVLNLPSCVETPDRQDVNHRRLEPGVEPIPGYRLISGLGSGGFGEVWKCHAPGGLFKALKVVPGEPHAANFPGEAELELQALERVKAIRHPFLLSLERIEVIDGDLVIVTELADRNLHEVAAEFRHQGLPGIPREWLVTLLGEAAEALDHLNFHHDLQHLDVKPQNLLLTCGHIKVADFGLVQCLRELTACRREEAQPQVGRSARITGMAPLYMPPEILQGTFSRHSDQYSLAIVYQELLTGQPPFSGRNTRQLAYQHAWEAPDLSPLPEEDRPIVARALAKNPKERFASCFDFLHALKSTATRIMTINNAPAPEVPATSEPPAAAESESFSADARTRVTRRPEVPPADEGPLVLGDAPPQEFLPGYRFFKSLARTPFSETWLVQTPRGVRRLARVLYGLPDAEPNGTGRDPLERVRLLNHSGLDPVELVRRESGRAVVLSDLPEKTLRDRLGEAQARKLPGIPRDELLGYLHKVAQTLDSLAKGHGLFHLGLNPNNLVFTGGKVQVAEFGFVHWLWWPAGHLIAPINPRYSAPEVFERQAVRAADQYSLALIFCEMLTGAHPLHGQQRPRAPGERFRCKPDLRLLSRGDREILARALAADPQKRFDRLCGHDPGPGRKPGRAHGGIEPGASSHKPGLADCGAMADHSTTHGRTASPVDAGPGRGRRGTPHSRAAGPRPHAGGPAPPADGLRRGHLAAAPERATALLFAAGGPAGTSMCGPSPQGGDALEAGRVRRSVGCRGGPGP